MDNERCGCGATDRVRVTVRRTDGRCVRACLPCQAAAVRKWKRANPDRVRAHRAVAKAVKRGRLQRRACEKCGAVPAEAHHRDYSAPLDVTWLCQKHHREQHRGTIRI